jgi:cytochrome c-type biogenesis protein CcmF
VTGLVGHLATICALILAISGAAVAFAAASPGRLALARRLSAALFAMVLVCALAMEVALVSHDFSVAYVAQIGSRETPLFYTVISLWSALQGSLILWALILSGYTAAVARWLARQPARAEQMAAPQTLGTLFVVNAFFLCLLAGPANPFGLVLPEPFDGPGPNPLLQNHPFMGVHPPLLYAGYVGMAVPFSFAIGALLRGRIGAGWARAVRHWILIPWGLLTVGIVAGAWWSYDVLGWGGYWAWDPVENASFMPWLTATALLHSVMVSERRGMLYTWTLLLAVATFLLTLLGTFITRSGVLVSVHAFSESAIGAWLLVFFAFVLLASLALLVSRGERLRGEGRLDRIVARESVFLLNNLILTAFAFIVLLGTMYPLIVEATRGAKVSVGAPYFDQMATPLALALVFLMGVGPALPWRAGSLTLLARQLRWPLAASVATGAGLALMGVREPYAWLTFVLAAFAMAVLVQEAVTPALARCRAHGESLPRALAEVTRSNRRRYGGYLAHAGVLLIAIGIAGSTTFRRDGEWTMRTGVIQQFGDYGLRVDTVWAVKEPNRDGVIAAVTVFRGNRITDHLYPRLNFYHNASEAIAKPAIQVRPGADLYLVLLAYTTDGHQTTMRAIVSPLVSWIWAGGIVMGLGVLFGLSGRTRPVPEPVPAGRPVPAARRPALEPVG